MLQTQLDPYATGSGVGVPQRQGNPALNPEGARDSKKMHEVRACGYVADGWRVGGRLNQARSKSEGH